MPATVALATTTLTEAVDASAGSIKVASTSGLTAGIRLFVDRELMSVVSLGLALRVNVLRGVDGTAASSHSSSSAITIGRGDQFYASDPVGAPPAAIEVSPWINVINGSVWYAQGDALGSSSRWWQNVTTTYGQGALGIRTTTSAPSEST